ncbi:MAG: pyruvate dehydrogenase complex dihydrolipoamide acetyltransferase [Rhodobacteraceae bacterium]|nr:pyruvate dehydrogenase complex dihydrolipoamide acetyltransferase [Paracoccaceae bacterium]
MAINILMPALSPTMEEGTLAKWLVKEGDTVQSGDLLAEIETDKATMEFEAVDEGVIGKILVTEGSEGVPVNAPIAVLLEEGEDTSTAIEPKTVPSVPYAPKNPEEDPKPITPTPAARQPDGARIFASPLARRIAVQNNIDLAQITGSGPNGRIVKADVEKTEVRTAAAPETPAPFATIPASPGADAIKKIYETREYEEITLDGMRKIIASRLTEAKQTIPHFYLRRSIHLDNLLKTRAEINKGLANTGQKLSVNDFIIKASAKALQAVPACNAVWAGDRILQMKASDVAVAVAIEGGLFTPVIEDAENLQLTTISAKMKDLATRARDRKLAPHEYQGGSFAISNLGMFGIENFDAVINPPHGSILAVGVGTKQPTVGEDGKITITTVMSVTLSVDHRVIDGALGAQFLSAFASFMENPLSMLV